ncbi:MAG: potassium-transporting ATPase KdpC subunit [Myxococcales bacterium]|jgi:K+-transporting ATPase ATPase C chain|nr:potassium-transporting ATPase KdpC subunit [Myxococcales bacterium]
MRKEIVIAIRVTLVTLILTGLLYPLAMTGAAQVLFPGRANGSLVRDEKGTVVGSELIGQIFATPPYLQGRPSAAGNGYDATASSGSNLGPTSKKLRDRAIADIARLQKENPEAPLPIPGELITTSASGLDPDLSPAAALWQVPRIARARQVAPERIREVIESRIQGRDLGVFGEPRVNVLAVNLALDQQFGKPAKPTPPAIPAAAAASK